MLFYYSWPPELEMTIYVLLELKRPGVWKGEKFVMCGFQAAERLIFVRSERN